ncbi:MAG: hypothetical protein OXE74_08355 [Cyanobacteria bacterium MAG CAR2_bin_4]|nr:hypothetical protein [Cyanobacteria bacterium MAG CAR2_bin_4]
MAILPARQVEKTAASTGMCRASRRRGCFGRGLAGVLCRRRGDRITIGFQAMARFTPHGGTVAYICGCLQDLNPGPNGPGF